MHAELIDTHAHLDLPEFEPDRDAVIVRACAAGVGYVLCPAISAASSLAVVALAEQHPQVLAAVGIHPNSCAEARPEDWDVVRRLARHGRVVAIGETGLDRYRDYSPLELQKEYLDRHLRLGAECGLPVILHCRDAEEDLVAMLREAVRRGKLEGVLHACSVDFETLGECMALGLHASFAGVVTYTNRKFDALRRVAAAVPESRILVETDSPYQTPHPLRNKQPRNEPAHVVYTAARLAALRGVPFETLAAQTTANARRLFKLH